MRTSSPYYLREGGDIFVGKALQAARRGRWDETWRRLKDVPIPQTLIKITLSTLAYYAILQKNAPALEDLFSRGLNPNERIKKKSDDTQVPLLGISILQLKPGATEVPMACLLNHGASPLQSQDDRFPLLGRVLDTENEVMLNLILTHGAILYHPHEEKCVSHLIHNPRIAKMLLDHGMTREDIEQWPWTASAETHHETEGMIRWMVSEGFILDAPRDDALDDKTALEDMINDDTGDELQLELIALLIRHGARIDRLDLDRARSLKGVNEALIDRACADLDIATPSAFATSASRRV